MIVVSMNVEEDVKDTMVSACYDFLCRFRLVRSSLLARMSQTGRLFCST
jgi:hypothetical protein